MMDDLFAGLTLLAILGSGTVAGVFFAFSAFVMSALARLPSAQGIAAMQSINVVVINPKFLGVFMGTALLCVALGVSSLMMWPENGGEFWHDYVEGWTMWNHVRTAASLLACFTFSFSLYYQAAGN